MMPWYGDAIFIVLAFVFGWAFAMIFSGFAIRAKIYSNIGHFYDWCKSADHTPTQQQVCQAACGDWRPWEKGQHEL